MSLVLAQPASIAMDSNIKFRTARVSIVLNLTCAFDQLLGVTFQFFR